MNQPPTPQYAELVPVTPANPLTTILRGLVTVARHVAEVFLQALVMMKEPISTLLALLLTSSILIATISMASDVAWSAVRSYDFCRLPLASLVPVCAVHGAPPSAISHVDFPQLMLIQHRALDGFLGQSSTGTELALNIKHAELAVQDLASLVKGSNLTVKGVLSEALAEFTDDAKQSSRALQLFSAKVHGTIDSISAFNAYSLHELEAARSKGKRATLEATLTQAFQVAMNTFSSHIARLLVDASITAGMLDTLEEHLSTIYALCVQEEHTTAIEEDELLWRLWTILGGNKEQRRDLAYRSTMLQDVQRYRSVAAAYVAAAMQTLTGVDADLAELRERLAAPYPEATGIPVEVHIDSIERGLYRLREEKLKWRNGSAGGQSLGPDGGRPGPKPASVEGGSA